MGIFDFFRPEQPTARQVTPKPVDFRDVPKFVADRFRSEPGRYYMENMTDAFGTKIGDPDTPFILESAFAPRRFENPVDKKNNIDFLQSRFYSQPDDSNRNPLVPPKPRNQGLGSLQYEPIKYKYKTGQTYADKLAKNAFNTASATKRNFKDPNYQGFFARQTDNPLLKGIYSNALDVPLNFAKFGLFGGLGVASKALGVGADVAGILLDGGGKGVMSTKQAQQFAKDLSVLPLSLMEAYGGKIGGMNAAARRLYMKELSKKYANIGFRDPLTLQLGSRKQPIFLGMEGATKAETKLLQKATDYAESLMKDQDGRTLYSNSPTFIQRLVENKFPGVVFDRKQMVPLIERPIPPSSINELDFLRSTSTLLGEPTSNPVKMPVTDFMSQVQRQAFLKYRKSDEEIEKIKERLKAKQESGEDFNWRDLKDLEMVDKPVLANIPIRKEFSGSREVGDAGGHFSPSTGEIVINTSADSFYVKGVDDAVKRYQNGDITKAEYLSDMTRVAEEYNQLVIHEGIHGIADGLKKFSQGNNPLNFMEISRKLKRYQSHVNQHKIKPPGVGPKTIFKSPSEKALYEALKLEHEVANKSNKLLRDPDGFKRLGLDYLAYIDDPGEMLANSSANLTKYGAEQVRLNTLAKMNKVRDDLLNSPQYALKQKISLGPKKGATLYKPKDALNLIDETIEMVKNGKSGDLSYMLNRAQTFNEISRQLKLSKENFGEVALSISRKNPTLSHREIIERTLYGKGSRVDNRY